MSDLVFGRSAAFSSVRIIESEHATTLPTAQPRTDDMRAMVDHMSLLGLIRRRPCAYQTPAGLIVHPEIAARLRATVAARAERFFDDNFLNTMRQR